MGSSYGGFLADSAKALSLQGTKYSGFNDRARKKDDAFITNVKNMRTNLQGIKERSDDRFTIKESMSAINANRRIYNMQNKYNQAGVYAGKHGMILRAKQISKLQNETSKKEISESIIIPIEDEIKEFKNGGVIEEVITESIIIPEYYNESIIIPIEDEIFKFQEGGSFNVIPEGALHARLHHMENDENITKKGIPVVSEDENGNLEQHAEIENSEIIFRLEVTKKLEELAKENTDESAIEAGKLLVEEILNNTIDHTNKLL